MLCREDVTWWTRNGLRGHDSPVPISVEVETAGQAAGTPGPVGIWDGVHSGTFNERRYHSLMAIT